MTAILHLVSRSGNQGDTLEQCLMHAAAGDALVLLEEAVVEALASGKMSARLRETEIAVYVIQAELELRGLGGRLLVNTVRPVDYPVLVALVAKFELSQTWS